MEKNILSQYKSLKSECDDIQLNIERLESRRDDLMMRMKADFVPDYLEADLKETEYLINRHIRLLHEREKRVEELIIAIEEYIDCIDDSRMRRMITMKYINGKTWYQVAQAMGAQYTEDSCKKQVHRFFGVI